MAEKFTMVCRILILVIACTKYIYIYIISYTMYFIPSIRYDVHYQDPCVYVVFQALKLFRVMYYASPGGSPALSFL